MTANTTHAGETAAIQRTTEQLLDNALAELLDYEQQSLRALLAPATRAYAEALAALHHALIRDFVPVSNVELTVSPEEVIGCITVHCTPEELAEAESLAGFAVTARQASDGTHYISLHREADGLRVELIVPGAHAAADTTADTTAPALH